MEGKKVNYWLIGGIAIILLIGGYYSYLRIEYARRNGVYTISTITKVRPARNGWKVYSVVWHRNQKYEYDGLVDWEVFSFTGNSSKRFFTKILEDKTSEGYWPVFVLEVPDSIQAAPPEGWSEEWMKIHFPEVVEYVHDTK